MLKILLYALLAWFLYNLVFKFIIPIYKTTRQMKEKFNEMQNRMQDQVNEQQDFGKRTSADTKASSKVSKEDYIDFEEIR